MRRALFFAVSCLAACGATDEPTSPVPDPGPSAGDEQPADASAAAPWVCRREGPEPVSDADRGIVAAVEELRGLAGDRAALDGRVDWTYWARWDRATRLHARDAPAATPITSPPHEPEALAEILALVPDGCTPIWVAGELRIDFPPAMVDTPPANVPEIEEVRRLAYEGQEVSAYCGACGIFAVLFREEPTGGYTVLRAADVRE